MVEQFTSREEERDAEIREYVEPIERAEQQSAVYARTRTAWEKNATCFVCTTPIARADEATLWVATGRVCHTAECFPGALAQAGSMLMRYGSRAFRAMRRR